ASIASRTAYCIGLPLPVSPTTRNEKGACGSSVRKTDSVRSGTVPASGVYPYTAPGDRPPTGMTHAAAVAPASTVVVPVGERRARTHGAVAFMDHMTVIECV